MNVAENVTTMTSAFVGALLLVASIYSLYVDYSSMRPEIYIVIDFILVIISSIILGGSLKLRRRITAYSVAANRAFDEVIYNRLKPIMEEVAIGILEVNEVKTKMESLEKAVASLEDKLSVRAAAPETGVAAFYMKTVVAMLVYFGTYLFMIQFTVPYENYLYILLYAYWWFFFTFEYRVQHRTEAWIALSIPVLLVPAGSILLRVLVGLTMLMAIVFVTSIIYGYLYYRYARELRKEELVKESADGFRREPFLKKIVADLVRYLKPKS